jgi:phage RecT family recombinase
MSQELAKSDALVISSPKDLMAYLTKAKSAIEMALPNHLKPDRMLRIALTCFSTNPDLRKCTAQSILASIVVASQLGLEPGVTGQAYLIPYKTTCTLIPGWQGLVGLLNNSGRATRSPAPGQIQQGGAGALQLHQRGDVCPEGRAAPGAQIHAAERGVE